jgi:hypothetical protein
LLERHTHRSGKDTVDHGRSGSDDYSNSLCGILYAMTARISSYDSSLAWVGGPGTDKDEQLSSEPRQPSIYEHPALGLFSSSGGYTGRYRNSSSYRNYHARF